MKKRNIINLITLVITTFLLIFVGRAWYVTNEKASVSGINAVSASDAFTLELQRGEYNAGSTDKWTWFDTNNLSVANMQPGNAFFFRFKIVASKAGKFKVSLNKIESSIQAGVLTRSSEGEAPNINYFVELYSTKIFKMDDATKLTIKNATTNLGVLYDNYTSEDGFKLKDYKVQDTFKFYDYGLGANDYFKTMDNNVSNDGAVTTNAKRLNEVSAEYTIASVEESNTWYGYFALEFNEALSLVEYKHLDGNVKSDSNLYQAQMLSIKEFALEEI